MVNLEEIFADPQSAATIIAALLGSFLAVATTIGAAVVAGKVEKRKELKRKESIIIQNYSERLALMEHSLQNALVETIKGVMTIDDTMGMAKSGRFNIGAVYEVEFPENITGGLVNRQLSNKWATLIVNINLTNCIVKEFREYYAYVRDESHKMFLNNLTPDKITLGHDLETILEISKSTKGALLSLESQLKEILAVVKSHGQIDSIDSIRFTSVNKLRDFEPNLLQIEKFSREVEEKFNQKMFGSVNS